jgi:oxygen-independent coproporphyrinogen-3 oxidase
MCHYKLDKKAIENKYNINFDQYFSEEEHRLEALAKDGLINLLPDRLEVTATGRLLIRNIAFAFDNYSQQKGEKTFSKAI